MSAPRRLFFLTFSLALLFPIQTVFAGCGISGGGDSYAEGSYYAQSYYQSYYQASYSVSNYQYFITPGITWFAIPNHNSLTVKIWGAGGSGGGGGGGGTIGGGGGGGGYSAYTFPAGTYTPGSLVKITIGAGGAPIIWYWGVSTNRPGNPGESSAFGAWSAAGGGAGDGIAQGGASGSGGWGATTYGLTGAGGAGGAGGNGGAGGGASAAGTAPGGGGGSSWGGGGGGAYGNGAGSTGAGAAGRIEITWADAVNPTCSVWADTSPIAYGGSTILRWTSSNAASFYLNNVGWVSPNTTGSTSVGPLASTNYGGTAYGTGGAADITCAYTLTVSAPASCTFNGSTVNHGESVTAYETATVPYGNTCSQEPRTCNNGTLGGTYTHTSCTVDNPPPLCTVSVSPTSISSGQSATLSWSSTYATSCTGDNFSTGGATSGNTSVSPTDTTTYTAFCTGVGGTSQCTGTGAGGIGTELEFSCTPTWSCAGNTITHTNALCVVTNETLCTAPYFCSAGSSVCLNGTPSGSLSLSRRIVQTNATVQVHWTTQDAASCTVTGTNGDSWSTTSGTHTSRAITEKTIYTLACDGLDSDTTVDFTEEETVVTLPFWKEL